MDVISTLPVELMLEIFQHIKSPRDATALAIAHERFFALYDPVARRRFRRIRVTHGQNLKRALDLLLAISLKPQLGHYVQHLEIDCSSHWGYEITLSPESLQSKSLEFVKRAIENSGLVDEGGEDYILQSLLRGTRKKPLCCRSRDECHCTLDILTILLASLSPQLESLSCCALGRYTCKYRPRWDDGKVTWEPEPEEVQEGSESLLGRFFFRVGRDPQRYPFLRHLKTVNFLPDTERTHRSLLVDKEYYRDTDFYHNLNVLRHLPAIELVKFEAMEDSAQHMSIAPPPRRANYSKLEFNHSIIREEVFNHIVESARVLTDLTIKTGGRTPRREDDHHGADLNLLLKSLFFYRDTLPDRDGELSDYEEDTWGQTQYELEWEDELSEEVSTSHHQGTPSDDSIQALQSFTRLRFLGCGIHSLCYLAHGIGGDKINPARFCLVDTLPPSLESLRIYGYDSNAPKDVDSDDPDGEYPDPWGQIILPWPVLHHQISELMTRKAESLPALEVVEGVTEEIPAGQTLHYHNEENLFMWEREIEKWSEDEWSEDEF